MLTSRLISPDFPPIPVGILHSCSGTMAISEMPLIDAEKMAIAEINQGGGVLGRQILPIVEDGASQSEIFAQKAQTLIQQDQVATIFGCWTSSSRKAVLPVLEKYNALLWYPLQYEGLESSPNVFYTGTCPNQQVQPAVQWLLTYKGKRFFLLGSDYVFPRTVNKIIKADLHRLNGELLQETYVPLGCTEFDDIIAKIQALQPDVIFSTLNGDSNLAFYQQYHRAGLTPEQMPIMAVSIAEVELQTIGEIAAGHYASWTYFQSLDLPSNRTFVQNFQSQYGATRVTSDPIEAAYLQVYLWKQSVEAAQSFDVDAVRQAAIGQVFDAPGGIVCIEVNQHLGKPCRIGQIQPNGQLKTVYDTGEPIQPLPWLGVEHLATDLSPLILDLLREVPQVIQYGCVAEEKSRKLKAANQQLQRTQEHLQISERQFRQLTQRQKALRRTLSSQIRGSLNLDTILQTAVKEVQELLRLDQCEFFWRDCSVLIHQVNPFYAAHNDRLPEHTRHHTEIDLTWLHQALAQQPLLVVNQVTNTSVLPQLDRNQLAEREVQSLLATNVHPSAGPHGYLVCTHYQHCHTWKPHEIELLEEIASQLAIAIEQATLYDESRSTAQRVIEQAATLESTLSDLRRTQTQLIQSEKLSSIGQLVAGVAHEINNPVTFIHGNLSCAEDYITDLLELVALYQERYPAPDPAIQSKAENIDLNFLMHDLPKVISSMQLGTDRICEIVKSLRTFSRLDEAAIKEVDIHEGLESTLTILQSRLKSQPDRVEILIERDYGNLPLVECFASQLNQVFMNLISNAIDAQEDQLVASPPEKLPQPYIRIQTTVPKANFVAIHIADNGTGMVDTVRDRIFDPFYTTKAPGYGTGLGLSISHQIVTEKHHGHLQCFSTIGEGTKFVITLPIQQQTKKGIA
ncbi:MAG: urea ABC transporter substrate-binding protein [Cyanobacteria bacterium P01_F01_bin.150]